MEQNPHLSSIQSCDKVQLPDFALLYVFPAVINAVIFITELLCFCSHTVLSHEIKG